jgi:4-aminobutyrate aminotransferase-like enzyme
VIETHAMMTTDELLERRYRVLGRGSPLFYEKPLHLVRGEGVWLYDADGRRYLDAYNNVPHVGHCHPHVVEAIARQAAILNTHTRYLHEGIVTYAERLTALFDRELSMAFLACTGSEANEIALRMATVCTGHKGILCTKFAYHGNTTAVAQISTVFPPPEGFGPHIRAITAPDSYRDPREAGGALSPAAWLGEIEAACASLEASGQGVAAILVDTILSSEGLPDLPATFIEQAVAIVRRAGGVYIADEVQPGFGRTGSHWWGYQRHGVVPDIVTLGKPMANGHPVSGVVARAELATEFAAKVMYFNTFGGNPVSCAAASAVLDVLERERLKDNARVVGDYALAGLTRLMQKHDVVGDVRGSGLFFGAELVSDRRSKQPATAETKRVVNAMRDHGVLISRIGVHDNILKIRPPMPFSKENADLLLATLDDALRGL